MIGAEGPALKADHNPAVAVDRRRPAFWRATSSSPIKTPIDALPSQQLIQPDSRGSSPDPITLAEARGDVVRDPRRGANEWFDHTLYSRLNDKIEGAIVLIMHRLHESLPSGMTGG